jgi:hypothetical protein
MHGKKKKNPTNGHKRPEIDLKQTEGAKETY